MNLKPTNISDEEKTRIFEESLKNQTPYVEKEPVKIQPVKHGKWIYVGSVRSWDELKCNVCNSAFSTEDRDLILNWDFCPHCGARMDGDAE